MMEEELGASRNPVAYSPPGQVWRPVRLITNLSVQVCEMYDNR